MNILTTVKTGLTIAKDWTVKHSPEILLVTGIGAGVGATVSGCVAVKKMEAINAKHKELLDSIREQFDDHNSSDYKHAITREYGRYGIEVGKTWAPCAGFTALSITSSLASFKIINGRLIASEAAFTGLSKFVEQYRANVIEDQGEEKDLYYANNGALKKKAELEKDGKYKEKDHKPGELIKKQEETIGPNAAYGIFHYIFNEDNVKWGRYSNNPTYNERWLLSAQTLFDRQLKEDGIVLLDEVYSRLGLDMTKLHEERAEGRTYGWTLNGYAEPGTDNDNFVSFGILEYNDTQHKLFRSGHINDITLHFNCRLLTKETNELLAKG